MASEDKATKAQIKRLYAVLHSLSIDPAKFKKQHNISSYAKLTRGECSEFIDDLEQQEAETKGVYDPGSGALTDEAVSAEGSSDHEETKGTNSNEVLDAVHAEAEMSRIARTMRLAVRESHAIVEQEVNGGGLGEATRAQLTEKLAVTMFIEAMRRGLSRTPV